MFVCLSTGGCQDLGLSRLEAIHFLERFANTIDGVEIVLATPKEVNDFSLDNRAQSFLSRFSHNSIHGPWLEFDPNDKPLIAKMLDLLRDIARIVHANHIVFHPNAIADLNQLQSLSIPVSIENLNAKPFHKGFRFISEFESLFLRHPFFGFTLDLSHALANDVAPDDFLVFRDRLKSVHVVGRYHNGQKMKEHGFLSEASQADRARCFQALSSGVPLVIEADYYPDKLDLIEKEIDLLRTLERSHAAYE